MFRILTIACSLAVAVVFSLGAASSEARQAPQKKPKQARQATQAKSQPPESCKAFAVMEASTG
jgi:hypothetical protein